MEPRGAAERGARWRLLLHPHLLPCMREERDRFVERIYLLQNEAAAPLWAAISAWRFITHPIGIRPRAHHSLLSSVPRAEHRNEFAGGLCCPAAGRWGAMASPRPRSSRAAPSGHLRDTGRYARRGRPLPTAPRRSAHLPGPREPRAVPGLCGARRRGASSAGAAISPAVPRNVFMGCQACP